MDYETMHDKGMKELLANSNPIQRGKGIFMKHNVVSGFRAAFAEARASGNIDADEMRDAGVQILASLLLCMVGPKPSTKLLMYKLFMQTFLEMNDLMEKGNADPE